MCCRAKPSENIAEMNPRLHRCIGSLCNARLLLLKLADFLFDRRQLRLGSANLTSQCGQLALQGLDLVLYCLHLAGVLPRVYCADRRRLICPWIC